MIHQSNGLNLVQNLANILKYECIIRAQNQGKSASDGHVK